MTRALRIYHNQVEHAILALTITLAKNGRVTFKDGADADAARFVRDMLGTGVPSTTEPRFVEASEGAAYMEGVASMLASSSRWLVSEEA